MWMKRALIVAALSVSLVAVAEQGWQGPELDGQSRAKDWLAGAEDVIGVRSGPKRAELGTPRGDAPQAEPPADGNPWERQQRRYGLVTRPHRGMGSWWAGRSLPFQHPGMDGLDMALVREEFLKVATGIEVLDTYLALLRLLNIKLYVGDWDYTLETKPEAHLTVLLAAGEKRAAATFLMRESEEQKGVYFLDDPQSALEEIGWRIEAFFKNTRPRLVFFSLTDAVPHERPFTPPYSIRVADIPVETGTRFHHYHPENADSERRRLNMEGWFVR